jgi:hypothetical protein
MKKVWVQMSKLPNELRDYLTIWAIGTILRVTKDVDMNFTRQYNRLKMQVLVLDPALIPSSVNIVIGDNVYELHFRVEPEDMQDAPKPLDTEDDSDEFNKKEEEEEAGGEINVTSYNRMGRWTTAWAGNLEQTQMDVMMEIKGIIKCKTLLRMRTLCRWRCLI